MATRPVVEMSCANATHTLNAIMLKNETVKMNGHKWRGGTLTAWPAARASRTMLVVPMKADRVRIANGGMSLSAIRIAGQVSPHARQIATSSSRACIGSGGLEDV